MNRKRRILAINGSYRDGGMTDQVVESIIEDLQARDARVEHVRLRDFPIGFCRNCRECMQQPGDKPGRCILDDGMGALLDKIEAADAYILAAPTNFSAVTALFKRFAERLAPYGYWPWGQPAPVFRKSKLPKKPAVIISSCAAPGVLGRLTYSTSQSLRIAARTIGGKVVGSVFAGMVSKQRMPRLSRRMQRKSRALAAKLAA